MLQLLTPCSCFLDKLFAGSLEGLMVDLTILGDEFNGDDILVKVSGDVLGVFVPAHQADFVC